MNSETWIWLTQAAIILTTIGGGGGVVYWLTNRVKDRFGTEGAGTVAVVVALSVLMAVAGLVVDGQLTPDIVQPNNAAVIVTMVFSFSQWWYRQLK